MQPVTKNIIFAICAVSLHGLLAAPPGVLEKDNETHRGWSDKLDEKFTGNAIYDKVARPIVHGVYHSGRAVESGNAAEWERAKDQFSKIGTGQQQTDYLEQHRALQGAEQQLKDDAEKWYEQYRSDVIRDLQDSSEQWK